MDAAGASSSAPSDAHWALWMRAWTRASEECGHGAQQSEIWRKAYSIWMRSHADKDTGINPFAVWFLDDLTHRIEHIAHAMPDFPLADDSRTQLEKATAKFLRVVDRVREQETRCKRTRERLDDKKARQQKRRRLAAEKNFGTTLASMKHLWPKPKHKYMLVFRWNEKCALLESTITSRCCQRKGGRRLAAIALLQRVHKIAFRDIVWANAHTIKLSRRVGAAKVVKAFRAAQYGVEWRTQIAHVEAYASRQEASDRQKDLRREVVQKGSTLVVEGPDLGPLRLLTMDGSVIDQAQIVKIEDALRDGHASESYSLAQYLTEWGPFLWEGLQKDREYINQGGVVGKAARQAKDMSWIDAQTLAMPCRGELLKPFMGGVMQEWE